MSHEPLRRTAVIEGSSNRSFGLVFATVFLIIAAYPLLFGSAFRWWSLAVAAAFGLAALFAPATLAPLNRLWTRFGLLLHRLVSPVVLGVMFYLVVTPTGLLMRALGKDPLRKIEVARLKPGSEAASGAYVIAREEYVGPILMQASWFIPTTLAGGAVIGLRAIRGRRHD